MTSFTSLWKSSINSRVSKPLDAPPQKNGGARSRTCWCFHVFPRLMLYLTELPRRTKWRGQDSNLRPLANEMVIPRRYRLDVYETSEVWRSIREMRASDTPSCHREERACAHRLSSTPRGTTTPRFVPAIPSDPKRRSHAVDQKIAWLQRS